MADDFRQASAPFFRQSDTQFSATLHRISALCMLLILPLVHYGARVLFMVIFGIIGAVLSEVIWQLAAKKPQTVTDLNAVEIGITCAVLMPACAHYLLATFTAAVAVLVGKMPFGGAYRTPFVPSAVGYCMSAICFPMATFTYSRLDENVTATLHAFSHDSVEVGYSQLGWLRQGEDPFTHINEYILGEVAGPLGTTSVLLLAVAAIWLFIGGHLAWQCVISFSLAAMAVSFGAPYNTAGSPVYIFYDLFGGSTFFCCLFMAACPNYCPKLATARYIWGAVCGALAVLMQHFGANEAGGAFAVLIMSPFANAFDCMVWYFRSRGISYKSVKKNAKERLRYRMKTQQERELDEIQ